MQHPGENLSLSPSSKKISLLVSLLSSIAPRDRQLREPRPRQQTGTSHSNISIQSSPLVHHSLTKPPPFSPSRLSRGRNRRRLLSLRRRLNMILHSTLHIPIRLRHRTLLSSRSCRRRRSILADRRRGGTRVRDRPTGPLDGATGLAEQTSETSRRFAGFTFGALAFGVGFGFLLFFAGEGAEAGAEEALAALVFCDGLGGGGRYGCGS